MTRRQVMRAEQLAAHWFSYQEACLLAIRARRPEPECRCTFQPSSDAVKDAAEHLYRVMNGGKP